MSAWERFLALSASGATTGMLTALVLSAVALLVALGLRRWQAADERRPGLASVVFLAIALVLTALRLSLVIIGHVTVVTHTLGVIGTLLLGMGIAITALQLVFEIIPGRFNIRVPTILHELVLLVSFVVIVLGTLGQQAFKDVTSVVATSAVITAVVGLALQSTLSNVFAGLALQMDRAFGTGDWISVGGRTGRIMEVRWRATVLRTREGDMLLIPNSRMIAEEVCNHSRPHTPHRRVVTIALGYQHPPNEVREALLASIRDTPGLLAKPEPSCALLEFGESAIVYGLFLWVDEYGRSMEVEGEVRTRLWYAARRAGFEIPFPQRTVHVVRNEAQLVAASADDWPARAEAIARVALFRRLSDEDREHLARGMRRATFAAGETIIEQGAPGDSLFLIRKGEVRVRLRRGAVSQELARLGPGDVVGEMSLLTGEPRSATCVATTDVECDIVGHDSLRAVLLARPQLLETLSEDVATRQAAVSEGGKALDALAAQNSQAARGLLASMRRFFDLT